MKKKNRYGFRYLIPRIDATDILKFSQDAIYATSVIEAYDLFCQQHLHDMHNIISIIMPNGTIISYNAFLDNMHKIAIDEDLEIVE